MRLLQESAPHHEVPPRRRPARHVRGSISVYESRGEYQIYVEHIEPVGLGALQLAFEQLKKRLEAEGLFAADRKKPLPLLPTASG